jgi:hypothetical protein
MAAEMQSPRTDALRDRKERKKMQAKLDTHEVAHGEHKYITDKHQNFHGEHIQAISQLTDMIIKFAELRTARPSPPPTSTTPSVADVKTDMRSRRIALVNGLKGRKTFHNESNNGFDRMTAGLKEDDAEAYLLAYFSAVDNELKSHNSAMTVLDGQMRGMMGGYGR